MFGRDIAIGAMPTIVGGHAYLSPEITGVVVGDYVVPADGSTPLPWQPRASGECCNLSGRV